MKTTRIILAVISVAFAVAGIIHTAISYAAVAADQETGFPATVALLLLIPYAVCSALFFAGWLIVNRIEKRDNKIDTPH